MLPDSEIEHLIETPEYQEYMRLLTERFANDPALELTRDIDRREKRLSELYSLLKKKKKKPNVIRLNLDWSPGVTKQILGRIRNSRLTRPSMATAGAISFVVLFSLIVLLLCC